MQQLPKATLDRVSTVAPPRGRPCTGPGPVRTIAHAKRRWGLGLLLAAHAPLRGAASGVGVAAPLMRAQCVAQR
eukprot:7020104-Prymnesium_polylepis.1